MSLRLSVYGVSDRGAVRAQNQDRFLVADLADLDGDLTAVSPAPDGSEGDASLGPLELSVGEAGAVLLVADGMGGHVGGERASELAADAIRDVLSGWATAHAAGSRESDTGEAPPQSEHPASSGDAFVHALADALQTANRRILDEGRRADLRGMGTTATLAGLLDDQVYVAQIGDSRAYLVRNGQMARITRDQSLVQDLIDSGVLTEEDARHVPSNQILQALGVASALEPALTHHQLRKGDLLLLCSDGLTGVIEDGEIREMAGAAEDLPTLGRELIELANRRGGPDNITVVVARLDGDRLTAPDTGDAPLRRAYGRRAD